MFSCNVNKYNATRQHHVACYVLLKFLFEEDLQKYLEPIFSHWWSDDHLTIFQKLEFITLGRLQSISYKCPAREYACSLLQHLQT